MPDHLVPARPAVLLDSDPGGHQRVRKIGVGTSEVVENAEHDVEFPDTPQRTGQAAEAAPDLRGGRTPARPALEAQHRQDLAQTARGHPGAMQRLDIVVEYRGSVTFEGADAARKGTLDRQGAHDGRWSRPAHTRAGTPEFTVT
jgi:hypothetical protein